MTSVTVPQYLPGEWLAVVTHDSAALLPATTTPAALRALWDSLRRGHDAPLVDHLGVLTAGGFTALPPFALVQVSGGRVHAVVRGAVEVDVTAAGRTRVLTARHVATWTEEALDGVDTVVVRAPGVAWSPAGETYPLVAGTVRAGALQVPVTLDALEDGGVEVDLVPPAGAVEVAAPGVEVPLTAAPQPEVTVPADDAPADDLPEVAVPEVAVPTDDASGGDASTPVVEVLDPVEDTLLRPEIRPPARPLAGPADGPAHVPAPAVAGDDREDPIAGSPVGGSPVAQPEVPLADVLADHDGTTVLSPDVVALRNQLPDWAGHALPTPVVVLAPPTVARLVLSTGDTVTLDRPVLLGRAPQVSRVASAQVPRLVTVPSPQQDISRTHAEVRMDGDDVVLTDLRSTNGVLVVRPHAAPQRLQPGEATVLQPGVLVDLGEGVTFTVETDA